MKNKKSILAIEDDIVYDEVDLAEREKEQLEIISKKYPRLHTFYKERGLIHFKNPTYLKD